MEKKKNTNELRDDGVEGWMHRVVEVRENHERAWDSSIAESST